VWRHRRRPARRSRCGVGGWPSGERDLGAAPPAGPAPGATPRSRLKRGSTVYRDRSTSEIIIGKLFVNNEEPIRHRVLPRTSKLMNFHENYELMQIALITCKFIRNYYKLNRFATAYEPDTDG
jgi:hypothetical protein